MTASHHRLAVLLTMSLGCMTLFYARARAQDGPRLASIKARVSKTTPRGREIIEKALNTKLEIFGQLTPQPLRDLINGRLGPDDTIGWEASPITGGRWRIILHYENHNHIQRYFQAKWEFNPKTGSLVLYERNNSMFVVEDWRSKMYHAGKRINIVEECVPFSIPNMGPPTKLSSLVDGRKYFIGYVQHNGAAEPEHPVIDRSGNYISYASNTGTGYEGEGMTVFVSDILGRRRVPILSRVDTLTPERFLEFEGHEYLLIADQNEGEYISFWVYDLHAGRFVVHAKGSIRRTARGIFSYFPLSRADDRDPGVKPIGTVTMKGLISGSRPLSLLPLTPIHGLTLKRNAKVFWNQSNLACIGEREMHEFIPAARTKVLILAECDTGYEVYYLDKIGLVRKKELMAIK